MLKALRKQYIFCAAFRYVLIFLTFCKIVPLLSTPNFFLLGEITEHYNPQVPHRNLQLPKLAACTPETTNHRNIHRQDRHREQPSKFVLGGFNVQIKSVKVCYSQSLSYGTCTGKELEIFKKNASDMT